MEVNGICYLTEYVNFFKTKFLEIIQNIQNNQNVLSVYEANLMKSVNLIKYVNLLNTFKLP